MDIYFINWMVTQHYHLFIFAPITHFSHWERFQFGSCVLLTYSTFPPFFLTLPYFLVVLDPPRLSCMFPASP